MITIQADFSHLDGAGRRRAVMTTAVVAVLLAVTACGEQPEQPTSTPPAASVPSVVLLAKDQAFGVLGAAGIHGDLVGGGTGAVIAQSPPGGWPIRPGEQNVLLRLGPDPWTPVVVGSMVESVLSRDPGAGQVVSLEPFAGKAGPAGPACDLVDGCAAVRMSAGAQQVLAIVRTATYEVLDITRTPQPANLARLRTEEDLIRIAAGLPDVQSWISGRPWTASVAGGGDGAWCFGAGPWVAVNLCDTVMVFAGSGPPLLVSVNWITGVGGGERVAG